LVDKLIGNDVSGCPNPAINQYQPPIQFTNSSWIILDFCNFFGLDFGIPLFRKRHVCLRRFLPSVRARGGTALPHGLPNGIQNEFPLSVKDQQETEAWQLLAHQRLEEELQVEVDGYVSF
jgi:hypothetical protein